MARTIQSAARGALVSVGQAFFATRTDEGALSAEGQPSLKNKPDGGQLPCSRSNRQPTKPRSSLPAKAALPDNKSSSNSPVVTATGGMNRVTFRKTGNQRRSSDTAYLVAIIAIARLLWLVRGSVYAHDLPTGTVERAIQATVKPEQLEIVYDFGLNPTTVRELWLAAGHQPISDELALSEAFLSWWSPSIVSHLAVRLDDRPCQPHHWESEVTYQHHLQFRCRLTYLLPPRRASRRLEIRDEGFADWPGYFRVAIKAKPAELLQWTDAAAILVRAERRATERLGPDRVVLPRIEAILAPHADAALHGSPPSDNRSTVSHQPLDQPGDEVPRASGGWQPPPAAERGGSKAAATPMNLGREQTSAAGSTSNDVYFYPWWAWILLGVLGICCMWISWMFIRK